MVPSTPYTYIQCPCSDSPIQDNNTPEESSDGRTFDPRAPRSNYSLYPLEYLLYCEDCQQIRCPRCVNEEIVTYYCPNCLFEVPSSNLRSEGNRCTRSCYQCPVCAGPIQAGEIQAEPDATLLGTDPTPISRPFALFCQYCNWSSSEIGLEFDRPSGIPAQLAKLKNGGAPKLTPKDVKDRRKENPDTPPVPDDLVDTELQFAHLKSFYSSQLQDASAGVGGMSLSEGMPYASPAALNRIMTLYNTGRGHQSGRQSGPSGFMREAMTTDEGLKLEQLDESAAIKKLFSGGWDATVSKEQRMQQLEPPRFQDELRPTQCILRTKRSKRCSVCRHIISKPENKVASTRFKLKLVAKQYIPSITIRPLRPTAPKIPVGSRPDYLQELPLKPLVPCQYILTFNNPLFDNIKVTLATPNNTPGRFSSKVTLLCPQFEVDANTDMWDDALRDDAERKRPGEESGGQAAAGKIYERGRNWVSIILEVIPPSLRVGNSEPLKEDEDVLEIPMFVRMEWETEAQGDMGGSSRKEEKEKKELAYWCAIGVGKISHE